MEPNMFLLHHARARVLCDLSVSWGGWVAFVVVCGCVFCVVVFCLHKCEGFRALRPSYSESASNSMHKRSKSGFKRCLIKHAAKHHLNALNVAVNGCEACGSIFSCW